MKSLNELNDGYNWPIVYNILLSKLLNVSG